MGGAPVLSLKQSGYINIYKVCPSSSQYLDLHLGFCAYMLHFRFSRSKFRLSSIQADLVFFNIFRVLVAQTKNAWLSDTGLILYNSIGISRLLPKQVPRVGVSWKRVSPFLRLSFSGLPSKQVRCMACSLWNCSPLCLLCVEYCHGQISSTKVGFGTSKVSCTSICINICTCRW